MQLLYQTYRIVITLVCSSKIKFPSKNSPKYLWSLPLYYGTVGCLKIDTGVSNSKVTHAVASFWNGLSFKTLKKKHLLVPVLTRCFSLLLCSALPFYLFKRVLRAYKASLITNLKLFKLFFEKCHNFSSVPHISAHMQTSVLSVSVATCLANIYLFKINKINTIKKCVICSKLTIKTPEKYHWRCSWCFYC